MSVVIQLDDRTVDLTRGEVWIGGEVLSLTIRENSLLNYFYVNQGRVVQRDELYREVWGHTVSLNTRAADFAIRRLRKKIERDPKQPSHLRTQYGEGYIFLLAEQRSERAALDGLLGRDEELEYLVDTFDSGAAVVTILGPGGQGKTTLARHFAAARSKRPVVFCDLSAATDLVTMLHAVSAALRLPVPEHSDLERWMGDLVRSMGPILLILDNVEQLVAPANRLLECCRGGLVWCLVTSRIRLPVGAVLLLGPLPIDAGEQLFLQRLADIRGALRITPKLREETRALVEQLDGLPLAIELAAARGRLFTPGTLQLRLSQRLSLLQDGASRSLRQTLDWSWSLLSPEQQTVFAQCGLFRGPFTVEAALKVVSADCDDLLVLLEELCDHSMVQTWADTEQPCLCLFESMRVYALEKLDALGLREHSETRYRRWVHAHARSLLRVLRETESIDALADIRRCAPDIHHAFSLTLQQDPEAATAFLGLQRRLLGPTRAARAGVQAVLDALDSLKPAPSAAAKAEALYWAALLDWDTPDADAWPVLRALNTVAEELQDEMLLARTEELIAHAHWTQGDLSEARIKLETAESRLMRLDAAPQLSKVTWHLAILNTVQGDFSEAERRARRARLVAPENEQTQLFVHTILGMIRILQGEHASAHSHLEKGLARASQVAEPRAVALALTNIGVHFSRLNELEQSADILMQALDTYNGLGLPHAGADALLLLAQVLLKQGDLAAAREYLEQHRHLQISAEVLPHRAAQSAWLRGLIDALQNHTELALLGFETCIHQSREGGLPLWEGLGWLGCLMTKGEPDRYASARQNVERLMVDQPLLQRGLQVVDGICVESGALFGPTAPLPLLQLLHSSGARQQ